jgi:hypothetical protein
MCTWVGNQRSRGVVTAQVRTDAVRSLRHQRRDLHQSTYPVPLERSGLILLSHGINKLHLILIKWVMDMKPRAVSVDSSK